MEDDLQGGTPEAQVETPLKESPTPDNTDQKVPKTYTQEEYSKMQSTLRTQLSEKDKALSESQTTLMEHEAELEALKGEVDNPYLDDEETGALAKKIRTLQIEVNKEKAKNKWLNSQIEEINKEKSKSERDRLVEELAVKHGIDPEVLKGCESSEEIRRLVTVISAIAPTVGDSVKKPPINSPPKASETFDSSKMQPIDWIKKGLEKAERK